jgi:dihydrofolate synthase/folylpolyglutamate synthase
VPADALTRIRARGPIGIRLGLARMRALLGELGDPQAGLHGVLVGGTNGKGSTAAIVASVLAAAGLSTSQSPSPHLQSERERVTVDGRPIGAPQLDALLDEVLRASGPGEAMHGPATEFELFTAAAFLWSARQSVDVVVMEVGLGGRLDATNTWDPEVAAITTVGLDHEAWLGDTIEAIAAEKAAIIKPGGRAVTGAAGAALSVIEARAREVGAPVRVCQPVPVASMDLGGLTLRDARLGTIRLPLLGRHQALNAAVALAIVAALGEAGVATVPDAAIVRGLAEARWPGRLEPVTYRDQVVLLDGAHNPDGAAALAAAVDELASGLPAGRPVLLLAMMSDKAVADVLATLTHSRVLRDARVVATDVPGSDRSLPAADLAAAWTAAAGRAAATTVEEVDAALDQALAMAAESGGILLVSGSLYLVGAVRSRLLPDEEAR